MVYEYIIYMLAISPSSRLLASERILDYTKQILNCFSFHGLSFEFKEFSFVQKNVMVCSDYRCEDTSIRPIIK